MKKVLKQLVLLAIIAVISFLSFSCKTHHDCSSSAEVKKFQRETRR